MYLKFEDLENGTLEIKGNELIKEYESRMKSKKEFIEFLKHILKNVKYKKNGKPFKDFRKGFKSSENEKDAFKTLGYKDFQYEIDENFGTYNLIITYFGDKYESKSLSIFESSYEKYDKDYEIESYEFVIYTINKQLKMLEDELKQFQEIDYKGTIEEIMNDVKKFVGDIYKTGVYNNENYGLRNIGYMIRDILKISLLGVR